MAGKTSKKAAKAVGKAASNGPGSSSKGFTAEARAAMKERARELKAEQRAGKNKADGEKAVLGTIAKLPEPDRNLGQKLHAIVMANGPDLFPKLWYGMPAYANKDGKVVCFFQAAAKFKTRYASFAFTDAANLDEGAMWQTGFAVKAVLAAEEARLAAMVKKAVS